MKNWDIWPNDLATLFVSLMDAPSDEAQALAVIFALVVWFGALVAPTVAAASLICKWWKI